MSKINELALRALVNVQTAAVTRRHEGQGTLEYIAMAAGFVLIAGAGWKIFGGKVSTFITNLWNQIMMGTNNKNW